MRRWRCRWKVVQQGARALSRPPGLHAALAALGGLVVGWVLGAAIALTPSSPAPGGRGIEDDGPLTITIPAGTAARLAAGEAVTVVPSTVSLAAGDRVVVVNQDAVSHLVGQYLIDPGETAVIRFEQPGQNRLVCTFHPGGSLEFAVGERPPLLEGLLVVGALVGLPLAALSGGITYIAARLLG